MSSSKSREQRYNLAADESAKRWLGSPLDALLGNRNARNRTTGTSTRSRKLSESDLERIKSIVKEHLGRWFTAEGDAIQDGALAIVEIFVRRATVYGLKIGGVNQQVVEDLLERSTWDQCAYDALIEVCAQQLKRCRSLPDELAVWLSSHLRGVHRRPKRAARTKHFVRNMLIADMVRVLVTPPNDIKATRRRNSKTAGTSPSACDIVSEALVSLGCNLSCAAVERIWKDQEHLENQASEKHGR